MIHSTGTRMVPSQREELANEDNVNAEIDICWDSNAKDLSKGFFLAMKPFANTQKPVEMTGYK